MPRVFEESVWAGTEASLQTCLTAEDTRVAKIEAGQAFGQSTEEESELPRLLELQGGLAVISIKGSLVNDDDSQWLEWMGATGYPEIREAMIAAAQDPEVKHILLDVDSGGGAVSGVEDTAALIRLVNDSVKPVTAFTDGAMYSAAYWLASAAGEIHATRSAGVGSIGVIAVHSERSKQLADNGIGVNVIRAGKYKALANSVEPLSDAGREQIQNRVDAAYKIFVGTVADHRGKSYEYADQVMAQGREFVGTAAADAGLVDSITTYDAMASKLRTLIDASNNLMDNRAKQSVNGLRVESTGDAGMARKTLSEKDLAALASGAKLEADQSPDDATKEVADKGSDEGAGVEATTEVETEATKTEEKTEADAQDAVNFAAVKFMTDELKAARAELLTAQIKCSKLEDKVTELEGVVNPLKDIAVKAVNNMRVALKGSVLDMSAVSPAQVLADYAATAKNFAAEFPVGGVAAVSADSGKSKSPVDARYLARVKATGFQKK
jgi:signal peptide peptidase SppA